MLINLDYSFALHTCFSHFPHFSACGTTSLAFSNNSLQGALLILPPLLLFPSFSPLLPLQMASHILATAVRESIVGLIILYDMCLVSALHTTRFLVAAVS